MTKLLLSGCCGKMGQTIARVASEHSQDFQIVAGLDVRQDLSCPFPVYVHPSDCQETADVLVDFSHPSALAGVLSFAQSRSMPVVIATTGLSEEQVAQIHAAAQSLPVFFSANMSIGVNLLLELAQKAASVLYGNFDIEIVEKHHNLKIDAPSGTALMLANAINQVLPEKQDYVYDRQSLHRKRTSHEIGIHSIRGGNIVGEHEILFAGTDEIISLQHTATSKEVFAVGAVKAAAFLRGKAPGLYNMKDLINEPI